MLILDDGAIASFFLAEAPFAFDAFGGIAQGNEDGSPGVRGLDEGTGHIHHTEPAMGALDGLSAGAALVQPDGVFLIEGEKGIKSLAEQLITRVAEHDLDGMIGKEDAAFVQVSEKDGVREAIEDGLIDLAAGEGAGGRVGATLRVACLQGPEV